jgi:hypothetical protein
MEIVATAQAAARANISVCADKIDDQARPGERPMRLSTPTAAMSNSI